MTTIQYRQLHYSTDICIIVPTLAIYYQENVGPKNKRGAFSIHLFLHLFSLSWDFPSQFQETIELFNILNFQFHAPHQFYFLFLVPWELIVAFVVEDFGSGSDFDSTEHTASVAELLLILQLVQSIGHLESAGVEADVWLFVLTVSLISSQYFSGRL